MRPIRKFLKECCLLARNARYPAVDLYFSYVHWCLNTGVPVLDQFTFLDLLECHGFKYREREDEAYFKGLVVLPSHRILCE